MKILIAIAAALAAAPAAAQPSAPADSYEVTVQFADLNLDNPVAQRALEARIAAGAKQVCGERSIFQISRYAAVQSCQQRFISTARQQVEQVRRAA